VLKEIGLIATVEEEVSITQSGVHALDLLATVSVPESIQPEVMVGSEEAPV
jgi:hypothetical protein